MSRKACVVMFALMVVQLATGCGSPDQTEQLTCPPTSTRGASSPQPLTTAAADHDMLKVIDDSLQAMAGPWRESYAGHEVDADAGRVTLWRKPSRKFDTAIEAIPHGDRITVLCAPHSSAELYRVVLNLARSNDGGLANEHPFSA